MFCSFVVQTQELLPERRFGGLFSFLIVQSWNNKAMENAWSGFCISTKAKSFRLWLVQTALSGKMVLHHFVHRFQHLLSPKLVRVHLKSASWIQVVNWYCWCCAYLWIGSQPFLEFVVAYRWEFHCKSGDIDQLQSTSFNSGTSLWEPRSWMNCWNLLQPKPRLTKHHEKPNPSANAKLNTQVCFYDQSIWNVCVSSFRYPEAEECLELAFQSLELQGADWSPRKSEPKCEHRFFKFLPITVRRICCLDVFVSCKKF